MANELHDEGEALSERLPGLRRPALGGGVTRHEVGALVAAIEAGVTQVTAPFRRKQEDSGQ